MNKHKQIINIAADMVSRRLNEYMSIDEVPFLPEDEDDTTTDSISDSSEITLYVIYDDCAARFFRNEDLSSLRTYINSGVTIEYDTHKFKSEDDAVDYVDYLDDDPDMFILWSDDPAHAQWIKEIVKK